MPWEPGRTGLFLAVVSGVSRTPLLPQVFEKTIAFIQPDVHAPSYLRRLQVLYHAMRAQRGFLRRLVYSYIGGRLSHEVVTEKLRNALHASGFQIGQGWGGGGEPHLELQSELLRYAVYSRGGFRNQNTVAKVSIKVRLLDLRFQQTILEPVISKSQTVTVTSPELLNTVADQTVVAIANHPALTQGLGVPRPRPEIVTV